MKRFLVLLSLLVATIGWTAPTNVTIPRTMAVVLHPTNATLMDWGTNLFGSNSVVLSANVRIGVSQLTNVSLGGLSLLQMLAWNGVTWTNVFETMPDSGGTFTGPVYSTSGSASNAPADNELVTAGYIERAFQSGQSLYTSGITNSAVTNEDGTLAFMFVDYIPTNGSRTYAAVTNTQYIGHSATSNRMSRLVGPITVDGYFSLAGSGGPSATVKPEIYYSYTGASNSWLGDWDTEAKALVNGATNLYTWLVSVPLTLSTNTAGFYVRRSFKVVAKSGTANVTIHYGTNTPSHSMISVPSTAFGDVYLGNNNTYTGSNSFTGGLGATGTGTPADGANISAWLPITVNGTNFFLPLYK